MNPLALDLNEKLSKSNPEIADMLSDLGKLMYYPKGILSQSAEANLQSIMQQSVWLLIKTVKCMLIH